MVMQTDAPVAPASSAKVTDARGNSCKLNGFLRQQNVIFIFVALVVSLLPVLIRIGSINGSVIQFFWQVSIAPFVIADYSEHALIAPTATAVDFSIVPLDLTFELRHNHLAGPICFLFYVLGRFLPAWLRMAILASMGMINIYLHLGVLFAHLLFWTCMFYFMMVGSQYFSRRPFLVTICGLVISLVYSLPFRMLAKGEVELPFKGLFQMVWMVWAMQVSLTAHCVYDGLYLDEDIADRPDAIRQKDVASRRAKAVSFEEFTLPMFVTQCFFFPNMTLCAPNLRDTIDYMHQKGDFASHKRPPMRLLWRTVFSVAVRWVAVSFILNKFLEFLPTENALEMLQASCLAYRVFWAVFAARKHHYRLQESWVLDEMNWVLIGLSLRYEKEKEEDISSATGAGSAHAVDKADTVSTSASKVVVSFDRMRNVDTYGIETAMTLGENFKYSDIIPSTWLKNDIFKRMPVPSWFAATHARDTFFKFAVTKLCFFTLWHGLTPTFCVMAFGFLVHDGVFAFLVSPRVDHWFDSQSQRQTSSPSIKRFASLSGVGLCIRSFIGSSTAWAFYCTVWFKSFTEIYKYMCSIYFYPFVVCGLAALLAVSLPHPSRSGSNLKKTN